jgi:hypothetical protein
MGKEEAATGRTPSPPSSSHSLDKNFGRDSPESTNDQTHSNGVIEKAQEAVTEANAQDSAVANDDNDIEYPTSWKLGLITLALCLSVFCMALDNTIIAVAIPKITDQFKSLDGPVPPKPDVEN